MIYIGIPISQLIDIKKEEMTKKLKDLGFIQI